MFLATESAGTAEKIALVLILIAAAFGAGLHFGAADVQSDWNMEKLRTASGTVQAVRAAVARIDSERDLDRKQTKKVIDDYETTLHEKNAIIDAQRADADARGMRFTASRNSVCAGSATATQTAGAGPADAQGDEISVELPAALAGRVRDIAEDADREVMRLSAKVDGLQQWIVSHGFFEH